MAYIQRKGQGKHMGKVEKILMRRDGITEHDARELVNECREALMNGDYEAIQDYLGLEDDYIFDIL